GLVLAGFVLLVAPVAVRPAPESAANVYARNLGRGEVVGKVVRTSGRLLHRRIQVLAGGRQWTVSVPGSGVVMADNRPASIHDLSLGTYVRAVGNRVGDTRLRADHLYVIGDRLALRKSGYLRRGGEGGYFA